MSRKLLLLILLNFSLTASGLCALKAQDPPAKPSNERVDPPTVTAKTTTMPADLSGTYAGTFKCEVAGLMGDTTLTINGNEFTTADGKTGRIVASTTNGYTAVALQVAGTDPAAPPTVVSLRARKYGNRLTLSPVAGSAQICSFATSRNVARTKKPAKVPAATGTEVANPAAVPTESPMPSQTPSPSPTPNPSPAPSPGEPTPSPSPTEPAPSPTPSPSPSPSPR